MTYITIKESKNAANLYVLKSRLDAEGIRCRIDGELSNQVLNHIPLVQVKLQVLEEDMELARPVLIENGEWQEEDERLSCPKCQSHAIGIVFQPSNILKIFQGFIMAAFSLGSGFSIYQKSELKCKNCGHRFFK